MLIQWIKPLYIMNKVNEYKVDCCCIWPHIYSLQYCAVARFKLLLCCWVYLVLAVCRGMLCRLQPECGCRYTCLGHRLTMLILSTVLNNSTSADTAKSVNQGQAGVWALCFCDNAADRNVTSPTWRTLLCHRQCQILLHNVIGSVTFVAMEISVFSAHRLWPAFFLRLCPQKQSSVSSSF